MGVTIDHRLSWKTHTTNVANKVRSSIAQLYSMRNVIPKKLKTSVYNAIVNSQLSYAIPVWGSFAKNDSLRPIFLLQKRALRNLFCIKRESKHIQGHTKSTFNMLGILTVYNVYNYMTLLHLVKIIRLREPILLCNLLRLEFTDIRRNRLYIPNFKLSHYQNNFCYQAPKYWNSLCSSTTYCNSITLAPSLNCQKTRLKKLFLKMQSYGDELQWTNLNRFLDPYLKAVKLDPYLTTDQTIKHDSSSLLNQRQKQNNEQLIMRELMPFTKNIGPCKFCSMIDTYFYVPSVQESISHVLTACPKYHELRSNLPEYLKSLVIRTDYKSILNSSPDMVTEFKLYIKNCTELREK